MNERDSDVKGMPIYGDSCTRSVSDPAAERVEVTDWYPANAPASKLWRCLEALRDLDNLLSGCEEMQSATVKRRRVKALATPLHSLAGAIRDLANALEQDADSRAQLTEDQLSSVRVLRKNLAEGVPSDQDGALRTLRNKMAAHVDKKLTPSAAREIVDAAQVNEVGRWIHRCLEALMNLLNLNVYAWTAGDSPDGYVKLMACEPFLVTLRVEGDTAVELAGPPQISRSPRLEVCDVLSEVVAKSQWMFGPEESRIRSLVENESPPDDWPDGELHV